MPWCPAPAVWRPAPFATVPADRGGAVSTLGHVLHRAAGTERCAPTLALCAPRRTARPPGEPRAVRLCAAARGGDEDSRHPPPASFGEALLRELGVPEARIAGTLAAAATLHSVPASERPLLQCTADAPQLSPEALAGVEGSAGSAAAAAAPLPWQSGAREAWAAAVRSHLETLQSLGLSPAEAAATLCLFPYALLLPAQPGLGPAATFLCELGLTPGELATVIRSAPRLLGFSPREHLDPTVTYLRGCGLRSNALCGLLRSAPTLALGAIEHKARTDRAAEQLGAAYQLQTQERATWAMETATAARAQLRKRGF